MNGYLPEMAILLSTMLLDFDQLLRLLQDSPEFIERWEAAMIATKKTVYLQLKEFVHLGLEL